MFLGGWLAPGQLVCSGMGAGLDLAGFQDVYYCVYIHLGAGDISALPVRSRDAAWLEGSDSAYIGLPRFHRLLDANAFQHMAMRTGR